MQDEPFIAPVIWYDIPTTDDRLIESGALTWRRPPLPLLGMQGDGYTVVIGKIEAIEETGDEVTIMGSVNRSAMPLDEEGNPMYGVGVDLDLLDVEYRNGLMVFRKARLVAATITNEPAYSKALIEFPE